MDIDDAFSRVNNLVLQGFGVKESIKILGYSEHLFYKNLPEQYKLELQQSRTLNSLYGVGILHNKGQRERLVAAFPFDRSYNYLESS